MWVNVLITDCEGNHRMVAIQAANLIEAGIKAEALYNNNWKELDETNNEDTPEGEKGEN
jgi:hypothetical protein